MSSSGRAAQLLAVVMSWSSDFQNPLSELWGWSCKSGQRVSPSPPCSVCRESSQGKTHPWRSVLLYLHQAVPNSPLDFSATFVENILIFFPTQALPYIFIPMGMGVSRYHSANRAAPPTLLCLMPRTHRVPQILGRGETFTPAAFHRCTASP